MSKLNHLINDSLVYHLTDFERLACECILDWILGGCVESTVERGDFGFQFNRNRYDKKPWFHYRHPGKNWVAWTCAGSKVIHIAHPIEAMAEMIGNASARASGQVLSHYQGQWPPPEETKPIPVYQERKANDQWDGSDIAPVWKEAANADR